MRNWNGINIDDKIFLKKDLEPNYEELKLELGKLFLVDR